MGAHGTCLLAGSSSAVAIAADLRDPQAVLDNPAVRAVLDLAQPVAVLLVAVPLFIPDAGDPAGIIQQLTQTVCPEVSQRVSRLRPTVCDPSLPDNLRHVLLTALLTRIELGPRRVTFRLHWQLSATAADPRSTTPTYPCMEQR